MKPGRAVTGIAPSIRITARAVLTAWLAWAVAGCQSTDTSLLPANDNNVEAKLVGTGGSVAGGSAVLHEVKSGVDIAIWLGSTGPGDYRVTIHANGNCTSPNGFAAGPPWAPPGVPMAVVLLRKNDDTRTLTASLPGYRVQGPNGVLGRSVVVHSGSSGSLEAQPGVRNNRIACGVIGAPGELFPRLGV